MANKQFVVVVITVGFQLDFQLARYLDARDRMILRRVKSTNARWVTHSGVDFLARRHAQLEQLGQNLRKRNDAARIRRRQRIGRFYLVAQTIPEQFPDVGFRQFDGDLEDVLPAIDFFALIAAGDDFIFRVQNFDAHTRRERFLPVVFDREGD